MSAKQQYKGGRPGPAQGGAAGAGKPGAKKRSNAQKIRDLKRQLARKDDKLPATIRLEKERLLASLLLTKTDSQQSEKEKKLATQYHKVKFFERVKVDRKLQQTNKKLEAETDAAKKAALAAEAAQYEGDLRYIKEYPKDRKYISILKLDSEMDKDSVARRAAIKAQVLSGSAPAGRSAAGGAAQESKASAGMVDDFFLQVKPAAAAAAGKGGSEGAGGAAMVGADDDGNAGATGASDAAETSPKEKKKKSKKSKKSKAKGEKRKAEDEDEDDDDGVGEGDDGDAGSGGGDAGESSSSAEVEKGKKKEKKSKKSKKSKKKSKREE